MIGDKETFELIEQVTPERWIGQQAFSPRFVDVAVREVLHNRQDQRTVGRCVDYRPPAAVGQDIEPVVGAGAVTPPRRGGAVLSAAWRPRPASATRGEASRGRRYAVAANRPRFHPPAHRSRRS